MIHTVKPRIVHPTIIHIHIPKTAGTTVNVVVGNAVKGTVFSFALPEHAEELEAMTQAERSSIDFVSGHQPYGLGRFFQRPVHYIACLREPRQRILSFYRFVLGSHSHPLHYFIRRHSHDFDSFLKLAAEEQRIRDPLDNIQVRMIAGDMDLRDHYDDGLRSALLNIDKGNFTLGDSQCLAILFGRLEQLLQLEFGPVIRLNVSRRGPSLDEEMAKLTPGARIVLERFVKWDTMLCSATGTALASEVTDLSLQINPAIVSAPLLASGAERRCQVEVPVSSACRGREDETAEPPGKLNNEDYVEHVGASNMDGEQFVTALYKATLLREPDQEGLWTHVAALKHGKSAEQIIRVFLESAEFHAKTDRLIGPYTLDVRPPMQVDLAVTAAEHDELWAQATQSWINFGVSERYWQVLNDPRWKLDNTTTAGITDAFYETGKADVDGLEAWLARNQTFLPTSGVCAEFGCGVGRCTIWLARRVSHVVAFDASESHLKLARARAELEGLNNIEFVHVQSESDLVHLDEMDFFYSTMAFQYYPPPLILSILRPVFEKLPIGSSAYFQVPTYGTGYSFRLRDHIGRLDSPGLEMQCIPQYAIFDLASDNGIISLEVSSDGTIDNLRRFTSTSFLMTKRSRTCPYE